MATLVVDNVRAEVPNWVTSLEAFRKWTASEEFPEKGSIWWINGDAWCDKSKEQLFTHGQVKGEFHRVLANFVVKSRSGLVLPDGALITNEGADLSGNPDLTYISFDAVESGRVELIEGKEHGDTEAVGSPEMVLEVVSDSSEEKDTELLRRAYFAAGVDEYWLVDARADPIRFDILKRNSKGFVVTRKQDGWIRSQVFAKSFRLFVELNRIGKPLYRLEVR